MNDVLSRPTDLKQIILRPADQAEFISFDLSNAGLQTFGLAGIEGASMSSLVLDSLGISLEHAWDALVDEAAAEYNCKLDIALKSILQMVLSAGLTLHLPNPSLVANETGGFEAFFKQSNRGLTIIANGDLSVEAYGDFGGEIWRAKIDRTLPRSKPVNASQIAWLMDRF